MNYLGVLLLDVQVVVEVLIDIVMFMLSVEQEGVDLGVIFMVLLCKVDEVINQVKCMFGVQVEIGGFNIYLNIDCNGKISVWCGCVEVCIMLKDFVVVFKLVG